MKAIGYRVPAPITDEAALVDIELPEPVPTGQDILVEVKAVAVNPVDYKVRRSTPPAEGEWKILGWDAAGIVRAVGPEVTQFQTGDAVYYAGTITRPGTNAELHLVDARIVGRKPATLDWAEAAALPLTSLTAWEALFDRLNVTRPVPGAAPAILIIGGAGGVGSIAIQIARQRTDLTVIATASRPETRDWVKALGAHHVIDHSQLASQIAELGIGAPAFVFSTTHTQQHVADIAELIAPQGRFGLIDDPDGFDIMLFKRKAVSIHHELMFTRPIFETPDMHEQGSILNAMAALVDQGKVRTTLTERLSPINAANLKQVHALIENGQAKGKIVLEGLSPTTPPPSQPQSCRSEKRSGKGDPMTKSIATASINREAAVALIDAAIAAAREIGIPAAVAVVDATGNLRAFERTDDAPFLTVDVAIDKAWSSASFGYPTHVWNDYVTNDPKVTPLAYRPRMVAVGGGYPILEDGKLIGGIGISGGNYQQDQDACVAALQYLGFELPA